MITIGHICPELLSLYGDTGNIQTMRKRLEWRGFEVDVKGFCLTEEVDFSVLDIVFIGGGSDRDQLLVCDHLRTMKQEMTAYVEEGGVLLAVCGGYQLLGHYYKLGEDLIEGLSILDIFTERDLSKRLTGNVVIESDLFELPIVGFENHGGRTYIRDHEPLGKMVSGHGNNGKDGFEGVKYKNVIGTYLHGPLLPKNPHLCDYILEKAVGEKLERLDDSMEIQANEYMRERVI